MSDSSKKFSSLPDGSIFSLGGKDNELDILYRTQNTSEAQNKDINDTHDTLISHEKEERYKYLIEIGRGGMGSILKTYDRNLRRDVAVKIHLTNDKNGIDTLDSESASPQLQQFIHEARITGKLEHPNIVPIHDLGIDSNRQPYFSMKLVKGTTLKTIISRNGSVSKRKMLSTFLQVCQGIEYAHDNKILHRDLKPENIMIGEYGEVLVMDWGLAASFSEIEALSASKSDTAPVGTPGYMSPEQAKNQYEQIGVESDIFSLGVILFEIISGKHLYSGNSKEELIQSSLTARFSHKEEFQKMNPALAKICKKALNREVAERYGSVKALAEDITAFLDNRFIPDYKLSRGKRIGQSLGVIGLFLTSILILAGGQIGVLPLYVDIFSFIIVLFGAFAYQLMAQGKNIFQKSASSSKNLSILKALDFQNGAFLSSVSGAIIGITALLANLDNEAYIASGMALSLIAVFYLFPVFLILRLSYLRAAREMSLFSLISPFSRSDIGQLTILFLFQIFLNVLVTSLILDAFVEMFSRGIYLFDAVLAGLLQLSSVSILFTLIFFRLVFTYRELFTALSHFFLSLSGGEIEPQNKVHAASVLRFFVETFFILQLSMAIIKQILLLGNLQDPESYVLQFFIFVTNAILAYLLYIALNLLIRKFLTKSAVNKTKTLLEAIQRDTLISQGSKNRFFDYFMVLGILLILLLFAFTAIVSAGGTISSLVAALLVSIFLLVIYHRKKVEKDISDK